MSIAAEPRAAVEVGFASWVLGRPLSLMLGMLALVQFGSWLPHYLTWPYWADHDVFANAARAWDLGEKPYRDVRQNNFPGTIYLFYVLGKTFGWGRPWTFFAFDAALLLALVSMLVAWSRRMFGRALPGLVGSLAFLNYYLGLDYCHTAQRDWQGPSLAVLALLVAQSWPGRAARVVAAVLAALAFSIRPQIVLFLPALLLEVSAKGGEPGEARVQVLRRAATWLVTFTAFVALAMLPLMVNGIFLDFLHSLRLVSFGSTYNKWTPDSFAKGWLAQASAFRWLVVPAAIWLLSRRTEHAWTARAWLLATAGATLYKPLSPQVHSYLDLPLVLAWSLNLAVLAGLVVSRSDIPSKIKLVSMVILLCIGIKNLRPEFCVVGPNLRAFATLRSGVEPEQAPPGYRHGPVPMSAYYSWNEYRAVLIYLRDHTKPTTKIASALKGDPAIVSEVARSSAFPAESITWLKMVDRRDEPAFVESIGRATDSVVLWTPGAFRENSPFQVPQIEAAIRRLYEFETRFGLIEVWRRRADQKSH